MCRIVHVILYIMRNFWSHNVPAVSDVFLRPMRKNAQRFYGRKKMWRSKMPQRGVAPTGVLHSLAAVRRRTVTVLLDDVKAYFIFYSNILSLPNISFIFSICFFCTFLFSPLFTASFNILITSNLLE